MTASDIVAALDGTTAAARFFGVKPPSVSYWLQHGAIPDDRLVAKAALLEQVTDGRFSRRSQFPATYREIWPELDAQEGAHAAQ